MTGAAGPHLEIQRLIPGRGRSRDKWVSERRFHAKIPAATISRVYGEMLFACPGLSWRLASVCGGEVLVERGPTEAVPGGDQWPVPGRLGLYLPSPSFLPFGKPKRPRPPEGLPPFTSRSWVSLAASLASSTPPGGWKLGFPVVLRTVGRALVGGPAPA